MLNLNGQVKQTLVFPESEGKVSGLYILGNFIVSWTQESYIRVFNISSEIKQSGQSRRFEDSRSLIGHIKLCSINSTGKKVGIISNNISATGSSVNHSFHVYDIDSDTFVDYNLGSDHIPIAIDWDKKEPRYFGVQVETSKQDLAKGEETKEDENSEDDTEQENEDEENKPSNR